MRARYNSKLELAREQAAAEGRSAAELLKVLAKETEKVDRESEELTRRLLAGEMALKEFVAAFLERRTLYHTRAAKLEAAQGMVV